MPDKSVSDPRSVTWNGSSWDAHCANGVAWSAQQSAAQLRDLLRLLDEAVGSVEVKPDGRRVELREIYGRAERLCKEVTAIAGTLNRAEMQAKLLAQPRLVAGEDA